MRPEIKQLLEGAKWIIVDDSGSALGRHGDLVVGIIEGLDVNAKIFWGDSDGIRSTRTSLSRCNGGGLEVGLRRLDGNHPPGSQIVGIWDQRDAIPRPEYGLLPEGMVTLCYSDVLSETTATAVATTVPSTKGQGVKFNIAKETSGKSVTAVLNNGKVLVADSKHPNWDEIIDELLNKEPTDTRVQELFDVSFVLGQKFDVLGDRLMVSNGRIYLDGEEVDDDVTKEILRFYTEGSKDLTGLVAFFHKMIMNPNRGSVQFLYQWLKRGSWSICDDGDFIGYKNVEKDTYLSFTSGRAIVDGVLVEGRIPNKPGSIVQMPRSEVVDKSGGPCATGLHVGTFEFAKTFHTLVEAGGNGVLVKVKMNPVNVVSVPSEASVAKMRVCKYVVLDETTKENATPHEPQANLVKHPAASNDDPFVKFVDFKAKDFEGLSRMAMRGLGAAWKVGTVRTNKADMVTLLTAEAKKRRKARDK